MRATQLSFCNKCGLCQEVCPAYKASALETDVARGRNRLLPLVGDERLPRGAAIELRERLGTCLGCGACVDVCPAGVRTNELVLDARAVLASRLALPLPMRLALRGVLLSPRRLGAFVAPLRLYEGTGMRGLARRSGLLGLLGWVGRAEGLLPQVPGAPLRRTLRRVSAEAESRRRSLGLSSRSGRVAYFAGCLTENLFPAVGRAVVGVLALNGFEVVVPPVSCCGVAHEAYGDRGALRRLARRNVKILLESGASAVVTDCASCAHALSRYGEFLRGDPTCGDRAAELAGMVRDVSRFLAEEGFAPPSGGLAGLATYHDPCHLARGLGVRAQPRYVLQAVPGLGFRELGEADWCCGGAGSFNLTHYEMSMRVLERKMSSVRASGARWLATSCPSCLLQLGYGLRRAGLAAEAVHPVELLWRAYRAAGAAGAARAAGGEARP